MKRRTPSDKPAVPAENLVPESLRTPCHPYQRRSEAPLFTVDPDGTEHRIGTIWFCEFRSWETGRPWDCRRIFNLRYKREKFPKDLVAQAIGKIFKNNTPGSWISKGFHITKVEGVWISMGEGGLNYLPPYKQESDLIPGALSILKWRQKHPGPLPPRPPDGTTGIPENLKDPEETQASETVADDIEEPPSFV